MGHAFVQTDEPLVWNREGKSYSLNEAKRLISKKCLKYISREYEDKQQEYEWEGDDFWNYASLGDKEGVIVSYFPHLNNKEIEKLAGIVYRLDASKAKLNQWLNASGNWIKPYSYSISKGIWLLNPKYEKLVKFYKNSSELPTTKRGVNYGAKVIVDDTEPLTMPPKLEYDDYQKGWRFNNMEEIKLSSQSPSNCYILVKSDENKDFWRKSKMSFENLKRMNHVLNESYGPALAIANDEIVWMGGFSREG
jgi:hypothetical protein